MAKPSPGRVSSTGLVEKALEEALLLAQAELVLARREAVQIAKSYSYATAICIVAVAFLFPTVMILAVAAALGLAPHVGGPALAFLAVGAVLAVITGGLAILGVKLLTRKHNAVGIIFRWLQFGDPQ